MSRLSLVATLLLACSPDPEVVDDTNDPVSDDTGAVDSGEDPGPSFCEEQGLTERPWVDASDSDAMYATAADVVLPTRNGDVSIKELWTGCESMLFIQEEPAQAQGYDQGIWERDHKDLFDRLPPNVHIFFLPASRDEAEREASLDALQTDMDRQIDRMDEDMQEWWNARIHYVTVKDTKPDGWLGDIMSNPGWGAAIDRFQRIRYIGSYADYERYDSAVGWFAPNLGMAANEPVYYNFESDRDDWMEAEDATVVPLFEGLEGGYVAFDLTLPDATTLAASDTLTIDLEMGCIGEGEFGTCPAWDYMAYLYLCDQSDDIENPYESTACEVGETQVGSCTSPLGEARDGTYTCKEDGSGYEDMVCDSCDVEVSRWITTYHREGRWVYDISPMLPLFDDGGASRRVIFHGGNPYTLNGALRFSNSGKAERPTALEYLDFAEATDTFTVPDWATKVELATVISQHGQTCGEFCDATHSFTFNEDTSPAVSRSFPEASTATSCMEQVADGTVPNQYGTWWYGRAGWCPGKEVKTVVHDITATVAEGENSVTYAVDGDAGTIRRRYWVLYSE